MTKGHFGCILAGLVLLGALFHSQAHTLAQKINSLTWTGSGKIALKLYREAEQTGLTDASLWFKLGLTLYEGQAYAPALEAFQHITHPETTCCQLFKFGAYVWQGHIYDLLGKRQQAMDFYQKALAVEDGNKGLLVRHDQFGLVVDRAWVVERLAKPFFAKGDGPQPKTK